MQKRSSENFRFIPSHNDKMDVDILMAFIQKSYAWTLYGYFVGHEVTYFVVQFHASKLLSQYGLEDVLLNGHDNIILKLHSPLILPRQANTYLYLPDFKLRSKHLLSPLITAS